MTGNINELLFKRFGIGAFASTAKNKVVLRRIAGKSTDSKDPHFQTGLTVPREIFNVEDIGYLYTVHRDHNGNYIFEKSSQVDKGVHERYS